MKYGAVPAGDTKGIGAPLIVLPSVAVPHPRPGPAWSDPSVVAALGAARQRHGHPVWGTTRGGVEGAGRVEPGVRGGVAITA